MDTGKQLAHSSDIGTKVTLLYQHRTKTAFEHFTKRVTPPRDAVGAKGSDQPSP